MKNAKDYKSEQRKYIGKIKKKIKEDMLFAEFQGYHQDLTGQAITSSQSFQIDREATEQPHGC